MLSRSPFIEVVGAARDGAEALELVEELTPDVITCDLNMPAMDGVAFVRAQMERRPVPILVVSIASGAAEQVLAALDAGAVDFVQKPTALATERLMEIADDLVEKVKAAAQATPLRVVPAVGARTEPLPRARGTSAVDIIVLGTSTGGPQSLKLVLGRLPADLSVPVAMVLHMPVGYTAMYAEKLNELGPLRVVEAQGGEEVVAGTAYLAPAGRHLVLEKDAIGCVRTRPC
jgi:two-component system chemotaxis response regulator CheB